MSKTLSFCVALLVSLLGLAPSALACKCMQLGVAEGLAKAAAVFEGRVTQVEKVLEEGETEARQLRVTLSVVRVWKALEGVERVTVTTNSESAACGFYFEPGQSYLVYAGSDDGLENPRVNSCSRTRPMRDADEDLVTLGAGVTPVKVDNTKASTTRGTTTPAPSAGDDKPAASPKGGCAVGPVNTTDSTGVGLMLLVIGFMWSRRRTS